VPVWAVLDYTETRTISRELLLVKVSILGPEYLEDQLAGGPSHEPRAAHRAHAEQQTNKLEREMALARHFEESSRPDPPPVLTEEEVNGRPLTPSEALRQRHQHLRSLHTLASQFGARLVDVSDHSVIVEMTGKTMRVEAFLALVKPYGIIESARTGAFFFCPQLFLRFAESILGRVDRYAAYPYRWAGRGRFFRPKRCCRCEPTSSRLRHVFQHQTEISKDYFFFG
jgi:acetolactate synthase small subunit